MVIWYKVAKATEYLAITGWQINDLKLAKKSWVFPGQRCTRFSLSPASYAFDVEATSSEKLPFRLPVVLTVGPNEDDPTMLKMYVKFMLPLDQNSDRVSNALHKIAEGEVMALAASMTMDAIFSGTEDFKRAVFDKVELHLKQLGLRMYNAYAKQLADVSGNEYFSCLRQKRQMEATNPAKVGVEEARMEEVVGSKRREGEALKKAADMDAQTSIHATKRLGDVKKEEARVKADVEIFEKQRDAEVAEADAALAVKKSELQKKTLAAANAVAAGEAEHRMELEKKNAMMQTEKLTSELLSKAATEHDVKVKEANGELYRRQKSAEAELYQQMMETEGRRAAAVAANAVAAGEAELRMELEKRNAMMQTEKLKSELLSKATVEHDVKVQEANGELYKSQKSAEADLYHQTKEAEGRLAAAAAAFLVRKQEADGEAYAKTQEAAGMETMAHAHQVHIDKLLSSLDGNYHAFRDYMMVDGGMYRDMARINADAVKGMQPHISICSNGIAAGVGGPGDGEQAAGLAAFEEMAGIYRMLPPTFAILPEQTRIQDWGGVRFNMARMRSAPSRAADDNSPEQIGIQDDNSPEQTITPNRAADDNSPEQTGIQDDNSPEQTITPSRADTDGRQMPQHFAINWEEWILSVQRFHRMGSPPSSAADADENSDGLGEDVYL